MSASVPSEGFRRLAVVTLAASLVLVAVGGAVRATDSGLACPTWPGCFSAGDFIPARDLHVWLEHSHRLIAGVVGLLIAALAVWALRRFRDRPGVLWPAVVAAVAVVVQSLLGAVVVLQLLRAELVTAHLGLAMLVVACLVMVAVNASPSAPAAPPSRRFARAAAGVAALTYVQILVGGHVTGIGAGLAYVGPQFPFLGIAAFSPMETPPQIYNVVHRVLAVILAGAVMWLIVVAKRTGQTGWALRLPRIATWLVVVQIVIGVANLATGLSFVSVIPHLAVASWIWTALWCTTVLAYRSVLTGAPSAGPAVESRPRINVS